MCFLQFPKISVLLLSDTWKLETSSGLAASNDLLSTQVVVCGMTYDNADDEQRQRSASDIS